MLLASLKEETKVKYEKDLAEHKVQMGGAPSEDPLV